MHRIRCERDFSVTVCCIAPVGLSEPLAVGVNARTMNISWQRPSQLNGPPPLYSVRRQSPAFNYPPQHVEFGTRFTGTGYYLFPSNTIPQGVTFTGTLRNFLFYSSNK